MTKSVTPENEGKKIHQTEQLTPNAKYNKLYSRKINFHAKHSQTNDILYLNFT